MGTLIVRQSIARVTVSTTVEQTKSVVVGNGFDANNVRNSPAPIETSVLGDVMPAQELLWNGLETELAHSLVLKIYTLGQFSIVHQESAEMVRNEPPALCTSGDMLLGIGRAAKR